MNISELARKLKVSPQELRQILSVVGIDIGAKAIKIDNRVARRVMNDWKNILKKYNDTVQQEEQEEEKKETEKKTKSEIEIPPLITVKELALLLNVPINKLMEVLMKNGIFVSLNERIDFDTAAIIAMDFGVKSKKQKQEKSEDNLIKEKYLTEILKEKTGLKTKERPPVVVVMGHVDHGKTKLLDTIRKTNVVDKEAGGITQHIGAYQVKKNDRIITFIDTPGHEAFTAMRSRGARVADIAILVVAADDGVKPQTIEAIKIAEKTHLPFIVALNKIDKPEANIDKVKQELSSYGVVPEDWGGKIICVPISAKDGTGIQELLDMVLLTVDLDKDKIQVDYGGKAVGTIIESHIDKAEGPIATVLVQKGTLKKGDLVNINREFAGKIRIMKDYNGQEIEEATPSMPVRISGLKAAVQVGDVLETTEKKGKIKKQKKTESKIEKQIIQADEAEEEDSGNRINVLLKADVLGSTEVIMESLEKIESNDIKIKIINRGLGNITESDVLQAEAIINSQHKDSKTLLIGFNVKVNPAAEILAKEKKVEIKIYYIIYDFLNDIKALVKEMSKPEIIKKETAKISVLEIFKTEKDSMVIGGKVLEGKAEKGDKLEVWRNKKKITEGALENLQSGKQEVDYVEKGQECGILFKGEPLIEKFDELIVFKEEEKQQ